MKSEQILDDVFSDQLRGELLQGEEVIWEGKPNISIELNIRFLLGFVITTFTMIQFYYLQIQVFYLLLLAIMIGCYRVYMHKKKVDHTRYILTNQRVLFQLYKNGETEIQTVPLREIRNTRSKIEHGKTGVIHLDLEKSSSINFKTDNLSAIKGKRKAPTLELIENVIEIEKLILNEKTKYLNS